MGKISNIIEGFGTENPVEAEWYQERLSICNSCEFNSKNGATLSIACKTLKLIGCPSEDKGSCNQCCCCVEEKCSVKAESCPKEKWKAMEVHSKEFKVKLLTNGSISNVNGVFIVDIGNTTDDNLSIQLQTDSISKTLFYESSKPGCSCTKTFPKEVKKGRSYEHSVSISLSVYGSQSKGLDLNFVGSGNMRCTLPLKFKFNRINTKL